MEKLAVVLVCLTILFVCLAIIIIVLETGYGEAIVEVIKGPGK